jgi:hypothetical protein
MSGTMFLNALLMDSLIIAYRRSFCEFELVSRPLLLAAPARAPLPEPDGADTLPDPDGADMFDVSTSWSARSNVLRSKLFEGADVFGGGALSSVFGKVPGRCRCGVSKGSGSSCKVKLRCLGSARSAYSRPAVRGRKYGGWEDEWLDESCVLDCAVERKSTDCGRLSVAGSGMPKCCNSSEAASGARFLWVSQTDGTSGR